MQIRRAVDGPSAGADWGSVPGGGWGVGVDGSDSRGPWLGELLCGNLDESFKFLTCWRAELKAELDVVECVLFEKLTPEGMCYAARGHSD